MGRDREVAAVRQALTRAGGAPQGLVWITGEAGIGKSALAAGIAESIDPFEVFHGVADQVGLRPFGAIVDAFGPGVLPQMQAALGLLPTKETKTKACTLRGSLSLWLHGEKRASTLLL